MTIFKNLMPATHLLHANRTPHWHLDNLAGRFVELSGCATSSVLTEAAALLLHTQQRGEMAAWITDQRSSFFPPDFAQYGIDLAALPVMQTRHPQQATQMADLLLRSGGFSLLVMDLHHQTELPLSAQTRLMALAKKYHTLFLCLTHTNHPRLGSLVSIRGVTHKQRTGTNEFTSTLHVVKDKRHGPGQMQKEVYRGPDGLC